MANKDNEEKNDSKTNRLNLRLNETMKKQLAELAEEMGISQNQVIENAFQLYYSQDVMTENIVLGRMTQLQQQITTLDRKVETFCGLMYSVLPYILGTQPDLPSSIVKKDGTKINPGLVKGEEIFDRLVMTYKKTWKAHKISFVQSIWADMQENLELTDNDTDRSN